MTSGGTQFLGQDLQVNVNTSDNLNKKNLYLPKDIL